MTKISSDKSLWPILEQARTALNTLYTQVSRKYNLDIAEWHVLMALYQQDGQRPSDLAKTIARPATSFTPILDNLERKGFIQRKPSPNDRRSVIITLTPQAHKLQTEAQQGESVIQEMLADRLTPEDYQTLLHLLASFAVDNREGSSSQQSS